MGTTIQGLTPLRKRESLREGVGYALRAAIISGEMAPGVVYSAPTLGAMFDVSATPVREAMLDLVREGMVEALPNKGYRVTEVSEAELDDITEVRLLLEPAMTARAVPQVPAADLPRLRVAADEIVTAVQNADLPGYVDADRRFHLALLAYAGNAVLTRCVSDLRARTRLFGLAPLLESGSLTASAQEHHDLLDLVEAGDADAVEQLMRRHIARVRGEWAGPAGA